MSALPHEAGVFSIRHLQVMDHACDLPLNGWQFSVDCLPAKWKMTKPLWLTVLVGSIGRLGLDLGCKTNIFLAVATSNCMKSSFILLKVCK